ncbi:MAG: hypothetical protein EXQ91_02445 [Alphaproteobacteria bacterium]|nr:hypothetical protein [Alphaproteobacteria bacterium]
MSGKQSNTVINHAEEVLERMPAIIRESLSPDQKKAFYAALKDTPWREHAVDMRLTLPVPFRPFYLTLVGDPEKRSPERRGNERSRHPL